jgi:hypothetical protein
MGAVSADVPAIVVPGSDAGWHSSQDWGQARTDVSCSICIAREATTERVELHRANIGALHRDVDGVHHDQSGGSAGDDAGSASIPAPDRAAWRMPTERPRRGEGRRPA